MSGDYVFDTEAIIAFLYNEPGHETVASLLEEVFTGTADGYVTETNASEVFYLVARFEGANDKPTAASLREGDRDLRALERQGLESSQLTGVSQRKSRPMEASRLPMHMLLGSLTNVRRPLWSELTMTLRNSLLRLICNGFGKAAFEWSSRQSTDVTH
jgi:hypothetical protein